MTKIFVAKPPAPLPPPQPDRHYSLSSEASMPKDRGIIAPLKYDPPPKGLYATSGGFMFDVECYVFDTASKLPIRAVNLKTGDKKTFTDRLGCARFNLTRGRHEILVEGFGYLEKGSFTPTATKFEPILLKLDLDSDSIFTIFSTGEVIQGERVLDNPGHGGTPSNLEAFLKQYGVALGVIGITGVAMYYWGKSRNQSH